MQSCTADGPEQARSTTAARLLYALGAIARVARFAADLAARQAKRAWGAGQLASAMLRVVAADGAVARGHGFRLLLGRQALFPAIAIRSTAWLDLTFLAEGADRAKLRSRSSAGAPSARRSVPGGHEIGRRTAELPAEDGVVAALSPKAGVAVVPKRAEALPARRRDHLSGHVVEAVQVAVAAATHCVHA